mgnify:CR=1 FL=1
MIRAYDEMYVDSAMNNLGDAFDYVASDLNMDKDEFLKLFISTGIAEEFGNLKCANAVILGALCAILKKHYLTEKDAADLDQTAFDGFAECFNGKEKIVKMNSEAYKLGLEAMAKQL